MENNPFFKTDFWGFDFKNVYIEIDDNEIIDKNLIMKIYFLKFHNYYDSYFIKQIEKNKKLVNDYFDIEIINSNSKIPEDKNSIIINKEMFIFDKIFYKNQYKYNYLYHINKMKKSKKEFKQRQEQHQLDLEAQISEIRKNFIKQFDKKIKNLN